MKIHEKYILRAIELGKNALGTAAPNPMVGAVIVYNNTIIGEGFTSAYGGNHAEVNAINSVRDKALLNRATLYVTLEPCAHFGKTPPCTDLIIKSKIPQVVIGVQDPHGVVSGKGVEKLRSSGCEVITGILEDECRRHHRRFLTLHEKQRPYIILKWAQSSDGFLAPDTSLREAQKPFWLTNHYSKQLVHQWRSEAEGILVGTNTVLLDNPNLTTRLWHGKSPLRIILDRTLKIPHSYNVFNTEAETIVFTQEKNHVNKKLSYFPIDFSANVPAQICELLYKKNILSIIVEGGRKTLESFISAGLWDEARIFTSPNTLNKGLKAPDIEGIEVGSLEIMKDRLNILVNEY